ncbi:MAG: hypothetical protein ACM3JG_12015 [Thiohalocapsa sp.]
MAKVWMAKVGSDPARGAAWREMSISECQQKLDLKPSNLYSDPAIAPKFGDTNKSAGVCSDPVAVVVKIEEKEAAQHHWQAGFYLLDLLPADAEKRMREPPICIGV